jgi:hypothetical protein
MPCDACHAVCDVCVSLCCVIVMRPDGLWREVWHRTKNVRFSRDRAIEITMKAFEMPTVEAVLERYEMETKQSNATSHAHAPSIHASSSPPTSTSHPRTSGTSVPTVSAPTHPHPSMLPPQPGDVRVTSSLPSSSTTAAPATNRGPATRSSPATSTSTVTPRKRAAASSDSDTSTRTPKQKKTRQQKV